MSEMRAVHVVMSGRVHGVGYRNWCAKRATSLGLSGWVRNCSDGTVEAVFSGPSGPVKSMMIAAREGPSGAQVQNLQMIGEVPVVRGGFEIRDTV